MAVARIYETRAADDDTGLTAHIVAVPAGSIGEPGYLEEPERLVADLELMVIGTVTAVDLVPALAQIMLSAESYGEPDIGSDPSDFFEGRPSRRHLSFAAYLAFQPIVLFESSPPSGVSLGALLSASPAAAGAGLGFVVASGSVPLLLVLVPAGAIIAHFGAAFVRGAARPLEQAGEDLSAAVLERLVSGFRYRSSSKQSDTGDENGEGDNDQ
jgi:hypothetical protein